MSVKNVVKRICVEIYYVLYSVKRILFGPTVRVMSVDETIDELINTDKSLVRFGDGELLMIRGRDVHFQKANPQLEAELAEILKYPYDGLMVSVQDIFSGLKLYVPKSIIFWKEHLLFYNKYYRKLCNKNRIYASTSFSRSYITIQDKSQSVRWFGKIKEIWKDKDVVIVEGAATRNGVGNDLLDTAGSVKRIICPSKNAYARFDEIRNECYKQSKDVLFLVTLGPAAKQLVRDLYLNGYRAIDIGQLDYEYRLFLQGATSKDEPTKAIEGPLDKYLSEILIRIE